MGSPVQFIGLDDGVCFDSLKGLPLSGPAPTQMFLQRQGRKQYLYVQQSGKQGFTVVDVSKPKKPKVITNVAQQHIDAVGSALAITQEAPPKSDHNSAMAGEGSRGGGARTPQSVKLLDVSDPAHPGQFRPSMV